MTGSRLCAGCGIEVARKDCHRNRYGDYICRTCQAGGFRFTKEKKRRHLLAKVIRYVLMGLVGIALAGLLFTATYVLFDHFASPPAPPPLSQ